MNLRHTTAILMAAATFAAPLKADISGPYLAARQASLVFDYEEAVKYYAQAIVEDPTNLALLQNAVVANVGEGDVLTAARISKTFQDAGGNNQIATLVVNMAELKDGTYDLAAQKSEQAEGLAPLLDGLLQGWALLGKGQMSDATAAFAEVAAQPDFAPLAYYHEALALAQVGDFEAADNILSGARHGPLTLSPRGLESHAQVLMQLEREDDALELLNAALQGGFSPELQAFKAKVEAGTGTDYTFVTTPQEGAAEVLFTLAALLQGRAAPEHVLIYTRLATFLRPDHAQAALISAEMLEDLGQYTLAETAYADVPNDHAAYFLAEMGRANALYADDRKDAATEVLSALAKSHPDIAMVHAAHGDYLGRADRDDEAIAAYSKSIELRGEDNRASWPVYYARGIVHERNDDFAAMESDFRKALELQPNHPDILNYLGYALVEQQIKLDEALGMIETAVAERPDSGYITDSLGWVFYRLGRYEEAVGPMERAVSLLPVDPIVNDHLGDVYWKVDRKREAEFQWKRALSFDPEEEEAERIRRKLEVGLDVVLEEEAANGTTETADN
ncbi:tetratricopeptide repeat protein [uncultured Litoreibacter sp.]|uniref:tetratricopeptide repeat protein n=1 Tax=uncultured Litoreibacter sp. TaxID=1392394 RepID=UPI002627CB9A|nr:tetratricopeptide repeat protein [uncultured Litoreibacter sp.]